MQPYTDSQRYDIKQHHTCTHCGVYTASQDQQWCLRCVCEFEQWLSREYCEMCHSVTVDHGSAYCDACSDLICSALIAEWENIMAGEGLY